MLNVRGNKPELDRSRVGVLGGVSNSRSSSSQQPSSPSPGLIVDGIKAKSPSGLVNCFIIKHPPSPEPPVILDEGAIIADVVAAVVDLIAEATADDEDEHVLTAVTETPDADADDDDNDDDVNAVAAVVATADELVTTVDDLVIEDDELLLITLVLVEVVDEIELVDD